MYDLRNLFQEITKTDTTIITQYCYFENSNMIHVLSKMFDLSFKFKLATIKTLNSAHIDERDYENVNKYREILLNQDLRVKHERDIFDDANIYVTFER